jgi:hypothetical protein
MPTASWNVRIKRVFAGTPADATLFARGRRSGFPGNRNTKVGCASRGSKQGSPSLRREFEPELHLNLVWPPVKLVDLLEHTVGNCMDGVERLNERLLRPLDTRHYADSARNNSGRPAALRGLHENRAAAVNRELYNRHASTFLVGPAFMTIRAFTGLSCERDQAGSRAWWEEKASLQADGFGEERSSMLASLARTRSASGCSRSSRMSSACSQAARASASPPAA